MGLFKERDIQSVFLSEYVTSLISEKVASIFDYLKKWFSIKSLSFNEILLLARHILGIVSIKLNNETVKHVRGISTAIFICKYGMFYVYILNEEKVLIMDENHYRKKFAGSSSNCNCGLVIASSFQQLIEVVCQFD